MSSTSTTDQCDTQLASFARARLPLRGPDLPLLVSLDVLLEECNVTKAAARLHLSQPALSSQLSRLRLIFDDPLLIPAENGRGLIASQFAASLHKRLKPALDLLSSAIQPELEQFNPRTATRCFNIAAGNTSAAMVLPVLAQRLAELGNAGITWTASESEASKVASQLERGETDLCLAPACMMPPGLRISDLITTPHVMAQRAGHPRGTARVNLEEYCSLQHINVGRDGKPHGFIDEHLYRLGRSRYVRIAVRDFSFVPALLMATDAVCTLPAELGHSIGSGIDIVELAFPLSAYTVCMGWHPRSDDDPGLVWLRSEIAALLGRPGQRREG